MTQAPSRAASRATAALDVSMEIGASKSASASSAGTTRRSSSSSETGTWPGRVELAADVDDRRALGEHRFGAGDRSGRVEMAPAVGERVRRHVEDAHELGRRFQRAQECVAMENPVVDGH